MKVAGTGLWRGVLALVLALCAGSVRAEQLRVRLVRASQEEGGVAASLQDVAPALRNTLVFKSYVLVAQGQAALPEGGAVALGDFHVACSGPAAQVRIRVTRGNAGLVNTVAGIQPGKPFILGGFPDGAGGQMILVFTVR